MFDNIWTSSMYSSSAPYHTRASGSYSMTLPANHVKTVADIAIQRPALTYKKSDILT